MKNIILKTNHKAVILLALLAFTVTSCSTKKEENTVEDITVEKEENSNLYPITTNQFSSAEMELNTLKPHEFRQSVKANGIFDVPPENKASVCAYFGGYVKEIDLLPGEKVKKGQVLFTLENPDYITIQQAYLEAKSQLNYLQSDYKRQQNLVKENITSQKKYLKAEADYRVTKVRFESLKKKLNLMQINAEELTENNIQTTIAVTSPLSGYVTAINVTKGTFLNPADIAISIINKEHLHLELTIFEKDLEKVSVGMPIEFKIQNGTNKKYEAFVHLINQSIDVKARTINIHGHLTNELNAALFRPGMYIEAEIFTSTQTKFALPEEAIVNIDEKYFVLLKKETAEQVLIFEKREVTIGQRSKEFIEIINKKDFNDKAEFLTKGAFNLITE